MKCIACKDRLVEYVEGFLPETDRQTMKAHLQECPSCRAEAEHLARTHARLLRDGQADPPASLAGAVMERIQRSETVKPREPMWRTIMAHKYATIGVVAAACLAAVTVAFIVAHREPTNITNSLSRQPVNPPVVATAPPASNGNLAPSSASTEDRIRRLGRRSLKELVTEADVIVVATRLDFASVQPKQPGDVAEVAIRFRVTRILKGDLPDEVITIQKPTPPVGAGVEELGRELILLLSPEYVAGKHPYAAYTSIKLEPEVQAILSGEGVAPTSPFSHPREIGSE